MTDALTEEEILRRAALEDLDQSRRAQRDAQTAFDGRKEHYEQEIVKFDQLTEEGIMDYARSELDVEHGFKYEQQLTQILREADERLMRAELRCQALGIRTDPEISYSNYSAYMDLCRNGDDYSQIDQDTSPEAPLRREGIEAWIHGIRETRNPESLEPHAPVSYDEWEWRPDDPMDSISVLDRDRCAVEISRWREHCARLRDGRVEGSVPGDVGSPEGGGRCIRRSV